MTRGSIGRWATLAAVLYNIQVAAAADLPAAAPVYKAPPPVATYDWSGFYVGGNIGYGWGRANATDTVNGRGIDVSGFFPVSFSHADTLSLDGVIGGGQIGYNWQALPNWVFGLEADWQGASQKVSQSHSDPYITLGFSSLSTTYEAKILWFGTVRGRVGYAWDRLLIYGTGGLCLWRAATCRNNDGQRQFFRHAIQRDYTLRCVECEGGLDRGCRC